MKCFECRLRGPCRECPPEETDAYTSMTLGAIIDELKRLQSVESLCGEVLATIKVNLDRGEFDAVRCVDTWREFVEKWKQRLAMLKGGCK